MEKAPGIELERVWPIMNIEDRLAIMKTISRFQKAWTSISFQKFGSLYYADDLNVSSPNQPLYMNAMNVQITDQRFAVGPSTGREFIDDGRADIEFDRGPCKSIVLQTPVGWLTTTREFIRRLSRCNWPSRNGLRFPNTTPAQDSSNPVWSWDIQTDKGKKLKALQHYLDLIKFLLLTDQAISSTHLWHGDLHVANIFVDPSEPTKVTSLIDWQSTELSPLYFQARQPHIIDYDGPPMVGLERPVFPEDFGELEATAKQRAKRLLHQ